MAFRNRPQAAVSDQDDYEDAEYEEDEEYIEDDEEIDEEDEDDEEYDVDSEEELLQHVPGGASLQSSAPRSGSAAPSAPTVTPWTGIASLPEPTQRTFQELLMQLKQDNRHGLTVLLLGKSMVGKSSTANSLFKEPVAQVTSFQQDTACPQLIKRSAAGFEMSVIDTQGLLDSDAVSTSALKSIAHFLKDKTVDVVLYLDRLDFYRVEKTDQEMMAAISDTLGPKIWRNTIIGLTHGKAIPPQNYFTDKQEEYTETRISTLRKAMRAAGAEKSASLPVAFVENSSHCAVNSAGEKVIGPNKDRRWLPELMTQIVSVAQSVPAFKYDPSISKKRNPNKRRRWLIPLFIIAQVALKKYVIDRVLEDDGVTGDQYGPFAPEHVKEERQRLKRDKERAKARREAEKEKLAKQASKRKAQARSQISAAGAKVKDTAQKALTTQDTESDSSSSDDDSSSDSD